MWPKQRGVILVIACFAGPLAGCGRKPTLVGTWIAIGPLNEAQTLKMTADGKYEAVTEGGSVKGKRLVNYRHGSYEFDGEKLTQTQLQTITMSGNTSREFIGPCTTTIHWISNDKFVDLDPSGSLTFTRTRAE